MSPLAPEHYGILLAAPLHPLEGPGSCRDLVSTRRGWIEGDAGMVPQISLSELINQFDVILLDSDGVLVCGPTAVPGALEAIERLNSLGKPYYVLTNDASALPETRAERYRRLGLVVDASRIITAGSLLTAHFSRLGSGRFAVRRDGNGGQR